MKTLNIARFYVYLFWLASGFIFVFLGYLSSDIFASNLIFLALGLYLLLLPGWLLAHLFRFSFDGFAEKISSFFVLSLTFYLIINLTGIFFGFSISVLIYITGLLLGLMFFLSLILEFLRPVRESQLSFSWKTLFIKENILFLLPMIFGLIIFFVVAQKGANYNGDPYFHLAIMRKAVDGNTLSLKALAFTKTANSNPAYAFPTWHIFLAEVSKITSLDIFTLWSKMLLPLMIFMFFSWYYLAKSIFGKKNLALFAAALTIIFIFNINTGYLFQRLPVPDTLSQYILLPLAFSLAIKYIFSEQKSKALLVILALALLLLLMIHGLHYFYFLFAIIFFSLLFLIAAFKDDNFKVIIKRIAWVLGVSLGVLFVLVMVLEIKMRLISKTLNAFRSSTEIETAYAKFSKWSLYSKWALIIMPLILLFCKNRRIIFIVSLFLLVPLVYFTPLQYFFSRNLSFVFTERFGINLLLYSLPISFILGFIVICLEGLFKNRSQKTIVVSALIFLAIVMVDVFLWQKNAEIVNKIFYFKPTLAFMNKYTPILFAVVSVLAIFLWILAKKNKPNFWSIREFQHSVLGFLIMFIFCFWLFSYPYSDALKILKQDDFWAKKTDYERKIFNLSQYGDDPNVISFIKNYIPAKSVILANPSSSRILPLLLDQYVAYNPKSSWEKKINSVFGFDLSPLQKKEIIFSPKYQIDYVYLTTPTTEQGNYFSSHPEDYELIYNNKVQIYRLIK